MKEENGTTAHGVAGGNSAMMDLRLTARVALALGAFGSIALWIHAAQHPPPIIIAGFVVWVLSPFVLLGAAHVLSKRWAHSTQSALYAVTVLISIASIAVYADDAVAHRTAHPAFVYVAIAPVSWVVSVVAIGFGAWLAKRKQVL
jgi:cation transport ATPase